jgi:hypothetical protein
MCYSAENTPEDAVYSTMHFIEKPDSPLGVVIEVNTP